MVEQPEAVHAARRRQFSSLAPRGVSPSAVTRKLVWREVRIGDEDRRATAELYQLVVHGLVAELVIGGVHEVARITRGDLIV